MTKAEQKKIETAKKRDFIEKTYAVILSSIPEQTKEIRKSVQIRIIHKNANRYIRFHNYSRDINFLLYGDGNVVIELSAFCHDKYTEQLFEYLPEAETQEMLWKKLKEILSWLIKVFLDSDVMDFHAYMDYVSYSKNMVVAYQTMIAEYHGKYKG